MRAIRISPSCKRRRIVSTARRRRSRSAPRERLGTSAGRSIGFQLRGVVVSGVTYSWREYLLWNAEHGFRYLTEYDGHWNDVIVRQGRAEGDDDRRHAAGRIQRDDLQAFPVGERETFFVLGEFPWEVRTGDKVEDDGLRRAAVHVVVAKRTADEVTWSLGTYTAPERIAEAFKLASPLPGAARRVRESAQSAIGRGRRDERHVFPAGGGACSCSP